MKSRFVYQLTEARFSWLAEPFRLRFGVTSTVRL